MKLLRLAIIAGALALSGGFAQAQTGSQYNAKLTITPVQNLPQGALVPVAGGEKVRLFAHFIALNLFLQVIGHSISAARARVPCMHD